MYRYWTSSLGIPSRFLLSAVVGAIISISAVSHATARPGECPAGITRSMIDTCLFDWLEATGYDPAFDAEPLCVDDATRPIIDVQLRILGDPFEFFVVAVRPGADVIEVILGSSDAGVFKCFANADPISFSDQHICRATILRSAPWRQFCQSRVHPPN